MAERVIQGRGIVSRGGGGRDNKFVSPPHEKVHVLMAADDDMDAVIGAIPPFVYSVTVAVL